MRVDIEQIDDVPIEMFTSANAIGMTVAEGGFETGFHAHTHGQLMLVQRGDITMQSERGLSVVAPQTALWIPAAATHKIKMRAPLAGYALLVEPKTAHLPTACGSFTTTPLLRELLMRASELPLDAPRNGMAGRLIGLIFDELAAARIDAHALPAPSDIRLRRMVDALAENPADDATLTVWAKRLGLGERTLTRLLLAETGLTFTRWRCQLHAVLAMQRLGAGASVQQVATDLGYESASSFVTMFKRTVGQTPGRYRR